MTFTDISLDKDKKIINDRFEFIVQEISILFDTAKGEVLGAPNFGTEFESFIWNLGISNSQISTYIRNAIVNNTLSSSEFDISVDTKILYGTQNDIIIVSIKIKDPETNEEITLPYKIS